MRKSAFTILIFLALALKSFATGQIPDLLIVGGDTLRLYANPLELYFTQGYPREFPGLMGCGSTACWRGYQAIWTIIDNKLYLLRIQSCHRAEQCSDTRPANLQQMFGDRFKDGKVFANWVTDSLTAPFGNSLRYVHMGYASTYEYDKLISVKAGNIEFIKDFHNIFPDPKRLSRYDDSLMHKTIFNLVDKKIRWNNLKKM